MTHLPHRSCLHCGDPLDDERYGSTLCQPCADFDDEQWAVSQPQPLTSLRRGECNFTGHHNERKVA